MKKRLFSLVLCLVMVFSLLPAFSLNASAAEPDDGITNPGPAHDESGALNLTKKLTSGANGTYDITMEGYATAEVTHQDYTEKVPTDFVVIVDQSGSMATTDMPVSNDSYTQASNVTLKQAAEGMYYVKDGDQFYRVYGQRGYLYAKYDGNKYYTYPTFAGDELFSIFSENDSTEKIAESRDWFYYRDDATGQYYKAKIRVKGVFMNYECYFSSLNEDGTERQTYGNRHGIFSASYYYDLRKVGSNVVGAFSEKVQEVMYLRKMGYNALYYRDVNGQIHYLNSNQNVQNAEFCNQNGDAISNNVDTNSNPSGGNKLTYSGLYQLTGAKETRLSSLETALNAFVGAVANEKDDNGKVDNRIAIVGFSSQNDSYAYNNTELLTGVDINSQQSETSFKEGSYSFPYYGANYSAAGNTGTNYNGPQYYSNGSPRQVQASDYAGALLSANTGTAESVTVNPGLSTAIKSVTAYGGTQPEDGFEMAEQIFRARTDTTYTLQYGDNAGEEVQRNKVVVFFTDGEPGNNYHANRYEEANEVVAQALDLKHYVDPNTNTVIPATVFTIGVFSNSDSAPLTYVAGTSKGVTEPDTQYTNHWSYVDKIQDDTYTSWGTRYYDYTYLFRQWIANQPTGYGTVANDTIFDYMSVVSSNYPDAEGFITQAWLNGNHEGTYLQATNDIRHMATAEATNKYYRMASNQDTLVKAFLEAVTLAGTATSESHSVDVDETAHLVDTINTEAFAIDGATYSVYKYPIKYENGSVVPDSNRQIVEVEGKQNVSVPTNGTVDVSEFDYSGDRVSELKPEGYKLVVKITGLVPTFTTGAQPSNKGNAAIMADGAEKPVVSIASPTLNLSTIAAKTYVIDYNAKTKLATESHQLVAADNNANGVFAKSADKGPYDVTYQLNAGVQNGEMTTVNNNNKEYRATINSAYTTVDTALVYGKPYDLDTKEFAENAGWTKINTVPASSVYYDDSFTEENAQVLEHPGDVVDQTGTFNGSNSHIFTFYGTGIDVYCTTIDNGGYVSARVYQGNTTSGTAEGTVTVKNQSQGAYNNTPTVHFADLTPGYHTVWIYANENANYQIDGVRVYNPVQAGTTAAEELNKTPEANAHYFNLHDLLLNENSDYDALSTEKYGELTGEEAAAVSGILYLDNAGAICMQSNDKNGDAQLIFKNQFELYEKNSPINEIYLQTTDGKAQGVAFQLANYPVTGANEKVYLGVSAPKLADPEHPAKVLINGEELTVSSSVDQYYDITKLIATEGATKGVVSIKTDPNDTNLISITNLKITGVTAEAITGQNPPADAANNSNSLNSYRRLAFAPMTTATVEAIAEETVPELFAIDPETTEDPGTPVTPENPDTPDQPDDPKPVWNDGVNSVQTILKTLFQYLLNSLNSLFSGLGKW